MKKIGILIGGIVIFLSIILILLYIFTPTTLKINGEKYNFSTTQLVYRGHTYNLEGIYEYEKKLDTPESNGGKDNEEIITLSNDVLTVTADDIEKNGIKLMVNGQSVLFDDGFTITFSNNNVDIEYAEGDLYSVADKIQFKDLFADKKGKNYYYFYQETCSHCQALKPTMTKFYSSLPEDEDLYLVDMQDENNIDAWYDWAAHEKKYGKDSEATDNPDYIDDPQEMKTLDDIKITGTPTMVITEGGKVTTYAVGNAEIQDELGY